MYLILGNGLLLAIGIIIALIVPHTIANFVVGGMLAFIYLVLFIWYLISRNKFIYKPSEGYYSVQFYVLLFLLTCIWFHLQCLKVGSDLLNTA